MSQMPTFRFVFRVREQAFVIAHGPLCGWLVGRAPAGFEDQVEAKAVRGDDGWRRIFLDTLPPDSVLEPLVQRCLIWDLAFGSARTLKSTDKRDDTPEREFVQRYATEALQYVQSRV